MAAPAPNHSVHNLLEFYHCILQSISKAYSRWAYRCGGKLRACATSTLKQMTSGQQVRAKV